MIWFRFTAAFLITAVPIVIGLTMPDIVNQPGVVEFGFAGYFYGVAIVASSRILYFHRRRRQIQIEDGTWTGFDPGEQTEPAGLLADLRDKTSNTNRYAAISAVFGLVGSIIFTATVMGWMVAGAHWIAAVVILLWFGFASLRWIRNWRQRPSFIFDARFGRLVKVVACFGVYTLLLLDLSWARGRLPQSSLGAIGSNIAVVLAYAGLIGILARWHRQSVALPDSNSTSA
jgi:hypothetical protein